MFQDRRSGSPPEYTQIADRYSDYMREPPNSPTAYGNHSLQPHHLGPTDASLGSVDELERLPGAMYPYRHSSLDSEAQPDSDGPAFLQWRNQQLAPWEYAELGEDYVLREDISGRIYASYQGEDQGLGLD